MMDMLLHFKYIIDLLPAYQFLTVCFFFFFFLLSLFQFTLACMKMGRLELAKKAIDLAEKKLSVDQWPEYYDTRNGKFIGKQARLYQTWSIAGYLTSKMLLENPEMASVLFWEEDYDILENCICALSNSTRKKCSRRLAKSQILVWSKDQIYTWKEIYILFLLYRL